MSSSALVTYIKKKINYANGNCVILFLGSRGKGKSYSSIRLASVIDPKFSIKKNIAFSKEELISNLNDKNMYKYKVDIFEEAGINTSSKNWMDELQRKLVNIIEIYRTDNSVLIINVPRLKRVDKDLRELVDIIIEMKTIDRKNKVAKGKVKIVERAELSDNVYYKFLRKIDKNNYCVTLSLTGFKHPGKKYTTPYEKKRLEMKQRVKQEANTEVEINKKSSEIRKKSMLNNSELFQELKNKYGSKKNIAKQITKLWRGQYLISTPAMGAILGISEYRSRQLKHFLDKELKNYLG